MTQNSLCSTVVHSFTNQHLCHHWLTCTKCHSHGNNDTHRACQTHIITQDLKYMHLWPWWRNIFTADLKPVLNWWKKGGDGEKSSFLTDERDTHKILMQNFFSMTAYDKHVKLLPLSGYHPSNISLLLPPPPPGFCWSFSFQLDTTIWHANGSEGCIDKHTPLTGKELKSMRYFAFSQPLHLRCCICHPDTWGFQIRNSLTTNKVPKASFVNVKGSVHKWKRRKTVTMITFFTFESVRGRSTRWCADVLFLHCRRAVHYQGPCRQPRLHLGSPEVARRLWNGMVRTE